MLETFQHLNIGSFEFPGGSINPSTISGYLGVNRMLSWIAAPWDWSIGNNARQKSSTNVSKRPAAVS